MCPKCQKLDSTWTIRAYFFDNSITSVWIFLRDAYYLPSSYRVFRGANRQKHVFKKNPAAPIWGKPPKVVGGKLLASGYWWAFFTLRMVPSRVRRASFLFCSRRGSVVFLVLNFGRTDQLAAKFSSLTSPPLLFPGAEPPHMTISKRE